MTSAQDLCDLFGRLRHHITTHGLHENDIHAVAGAAPDQPRLRCRKRNEHLVIFAAKRAAAFGFQHSNDTERLSFDPNCLACNSIR